MGVTASSYSVASAEAAPASALDPTAWKSFALIEKEKLTHNTNLYRFALDDPGQVVGLPVASCLLTRAPVGTKPDGSPSFAIRPYTPTSLKDAKGHFDLVVKVYGDGKMSKYIDGLKVGDKLDVKGPILKVPYTPNKWKAIGMVAGGTGITPMLQVIDEIMRNPEDKTQVNLLFANQSPSDIILREKIDALAKEHSNLKVHNIVDKVSGLDKVTWSGSVGYVTPDLLKQHMPPPSKENMVFVCGPPGMMIAVSGDKAQDKSQGELSGALKSLGYTSDQVFKF